MKHEYFAHLLNMSSLSYWHRVKNNLKILRFLLIERRVLIFEYEQILVQCKIKVFDEI